MTTPEILSRLEAVDRRAIKRERNRLRMREWRKNHPDEDKVVRDRFYLKNAEVLRDRARKFRAENKAKVALWNKRWRENNKEYQEEHRRNYYTQNREAIIARSREKYKRNAESIKLKAREYYLRNKEEALLRVQRYAKKNRDKIKNQRRSYYARNPLLFRGLRHQRRARKKACAGDSTANLFFKNLKSKSSVPCYYCGKRISPAKAHVDHVIPLARNGSHTAANLAASCPSCNLSKNKKVPSEFIKKGQALLNL